MNQINLDKLLQLAPGAPADTAALKLVVAQVYQGQIQQLSSDGFRLQLPSAQGALQIDLPASASTSLQQLVQRNLTDPLQNFATQQLAYNARLHKVPVQVQFQPQPDGQIKLSVQSSTAPVTLTLQPQQLRALLIALFSSQNAATLVKSGDSNSSAALVTAKLQTQGNNYQVQLPTLPPLQLKTDAQSSLATALAGSHSKQLTVVLQLTSHDKTLSTNLLLGAAQGQSPGVTLLDKPQQLALMRQLVQAFNQLQLSTANSQHPAMQILKPVIAARPDLSGSYQVQLQPSAQPLQLQLIPQKAQLQLSVSPEDSNRAIQFVAPGASSQTTTAKPQTGANSLPQVVQQAWRNLLPLLSAHADLLADLPELPEPVQQVLQLVRQSQPDSSKVLSATQLVSQLQSLLQFQPLQNQPNVQTSGGALAVAIQLLLGHLMQKPQNAALQPANQKLAQLINTLEPAQASSLLRQLASHSSTLQQSQLATLDSNQATQQHLLLQLPLQQGEQSVFSQIQLEQREADGKQQPGKETQWQLTMRFELQQLGALLVVAKLQQQQLQLQFYTEQQEAKQLADRFLPILKDRCTMQGLVVSEAECVLGKIPDTLLPRANSLLAIKV